MQKVLTAAQMREVDRLTTERYGIPSIILMENAAHAVARVITEKLGGSVKGKSILILCGKGNNGGDGAALARVLWTQGADISLCLMFPDDQYRGDSRINLDIFLKLHKKQKSSDGANLCVIEVGAHRMFFDSWENYIGHSVVVDAIFGTGLDSPLRDDFALLAKTFSSSFDDKKRPLFLSIDIPSGIDADYSTPPGACFRADVTVSFTAAKLGNVLPPASDLNGELKIAMIGSPPKLIDEQPSQLFVAENRDAAQWLELSQFSNSSYKNKRGHALIIAGSETYSGAAVLAGNSAIRSGVGLVTLACPAEAKTEIASRILPEIILANLGSKELNDLTQKANAIAVGPGFPATDPEIESLVRKIVEERTTPVIVDAGALWFFSPMHGPTEEKLALQKPAREQGLDTQVDVEALADKNVRVPPLILTPHEGEFLRLLGTEDKNAIKDRVATVREFATTNNVNLVLKGERVLIGHPDGRVVVNPTGNSGLGKAGNGDTLTGILAGFCAQAAAMDIDIFETVVAAVYIAGLAGDIAEKKYGKRVMTASDVRECLADAFARVEEGG
ncbi:MAG: NAD(P)H-hydrate dehydratase [Pyrinomonadaceae bacterium]